MKAWLTHADTDPPKVDRELERHIDATREVMGICSSISRPNKRNPSVRATWHTGQRVEFMDNTSHAHGAS